MRVVATERGYDNVAVREKDDEFDMPEGSVAPWFKPVETKQAKADKQSKKADDLV